jgi:hypothetical protein
VHEIGQSPYQSHVKLKTLLYAKACTRTDFSSSAARNNA